MAYLKKSCDHCGEGYQPTSASQRWCLDCLPKSESQRGKTLLARYNLTQKQYDAMYFEQDGRCLICDEQEAVVVDHDHRCCNNENRVTCGRCVRGLLCRFCNTDLQWYEKYIINVNRYIGSKMKLIQKIPYDWKKTPDFNEPQLRSLSMDGWVAVDYQPFEDVIVMVKEVD